MTDKEARQFRTACRHLAERLGTPAFESALASFYAALAALRKSEDNHDH